jgi:hypothetical protein
MLSASPDRFAEDVLVVPVVVPELERGNVERHVLGADLVKSADHTAFEDRPEAFNLVLGETVSSTSTMPMNLRNPN